MKKNKEQQTYLMDQLRLWEEVREQGIDPESVKRFGFDVKHLDPRERRDYARMDLYPSYEFRNEDGQARMKSSFFNYVVLVDGTRQKLDPPLEAPLNDDERRKLANAIRDFKSRPGNLRRRARS